MILQRFRFTVVPGTRFDRIVAISMNPRHGLLMIVGNQDRNYPLAKCAGRSERWFIFPRTDLVNQRRR
jgi:hypothetical protein